MHRNNLQYNYQSVTPASNMVLKKKWDEKQYNLHRSKVDNAKPSIDNKLSMRHIEFHLHLKKLRNEVEEKRRTKIENENRAIYHHIINAKGTIDSCKRFDRGLSLALAMDEVSRSRPSSACSKKYPSYSSRPSSAK